MSLFSSAKVASGSVEWSNGVDLGFDTLYLESLTFAGGRDSTS
ncbi:hypothetical protein IQE94_17000 [Synechocystis sp. PCC 7339]|nr:hypothetical protein IQE94_17000 [Synechocystis sp. PCC 7339]